MRQSIHSAFSNHFLSKSGFNSLKHTAQVIGILAIITCINFSVDYDYNILFHTHIGKPRQDYRDATRVNTNTDYLLAYTRDVT